MGQTGLSLDSLDISRRKSGAFGHRMSSLTAKLPLWLGSCLRKQTPALRIPADHKVAVTVLHDKA